MIGGVSRAARGFLKILDRSAARSSRSLVQYEMSLKLEGEPFMMGG